MAPTSFPTFVLALATAAARLGSLIVAVEFADDAREPTAAYLRSHGTVNDRLPMLSTPSWQRRDGRASLAMLAMVEGLRKLVSVGADIEIDVLDAAAPGNPRSEWNQIAREQLLAQRLLEIRGRGATLVLSGNVHAEFVPRSDAAADLIPAAALIAAETRVVSRRTPRRRCIVVHSADRGELVTAAHPVEGRDLGSRTFLEIDPLSPSRRGIAYVGRITPSPPTITP